MKTELYSAKNISNGVLEYFIFDQIGIDPNTGSGLSGRRVADDFDFIQSAMKNEVRQINVRINSGGGSIIDGLSIVHAIRNSTIPVDTYVDGIAASIAGVIAMSGRKRFMNDYGRLMIHDPSIDTADDLTDQDRETLTQFKDVISTILSNNSTFTKDEINTFMSAETWFNAEQSLDAGLIDSIVKTERNIGLMQNNSKSIYLFANAIRNQSDKNKNSESMKKIFLTLTNLKKFKNNETENDSEKIETAAVETLESQNAKIAELELAVSEKDAKIAELESIQKTETDAKVESAVDQAINDGKIDVAKRAEMLVVAKKDITVFNTIVSSVSKKPKNVLKVILDAAGKEIDGADGKVNGKTLRQLEKTDAKLVDQIRNENPDLFEKLYVAQYGKKPATV